MTASLLPAFDVSSWQGSLGNLSRYRCAYARASYGLGNAETAYAEHITQIVSAGLLAGAYHAGVDTNGAVQAAYFLGKLAAITAQPRYLVIDTREFGMTVAECNAFILYCQQHDPLKRPVLVYDSEGNWQSGYVPHAGDIVANYSHMPSRPFVIWQTAPSGGPAGGDSDLVDVVALDKLLLGRTAPKWVKGPLDAEVNVKPQAIIYQLDGRTRYSQTAAGGHTTFPAPGLATGWTMILDGSVYAAVRDSDLQAASASA